ncbi:MAG TPA: hypothetical protein VFP58_09900 [Candidatus Eisenbacteria bacterium]|nr:hypothetical protein [Candidatus Eisenbacteria bacterium]
MHARSTGPLALFLFVLLSFLPGCSDEDGSGLLQEVVLELPPTLGTVWPNDDGRSWSYRLDQRGWDEVPPTVYAAPESIPPIPTLDEVESLLGNHPIGPNPVLDAAGYRMQFLGMKTTESGAVGQNLVTEMYELPATSATSNLVSVRPGAGFWLSLARARPDLLPRIAARWPEVGRRAATAGADFADVDPPLYLFGYAWTKTSQYIGSYGDLNTSLSWKYLEANLEPGHEFTLQLVPDLADNVFLHARVLRERTVTTVLGDHPSAIDVLYMVDYGVNEVFDSQMNAIGYAHSYDYGTITYAPFVGPVATYERSLIYAGETQHPGWRELTGAITDVQPRGTLP